MNMQLPNHLLFSEIEKLLEEGHTVTLRTKGSSMFPFIVGGRDSVVLQKAEKLQKGDIVLARLPGKDYVLHRIYRLRNEEVLLMGDGNLCATEHCMRKDVRGKVTAIIRNGKTIDCEAEGERRRARWWQRLLPLRRILIKIGKYVCT